MTLDDDSIGLAPGSGLQIVGEGSIGGKAQGLAYLNDMLHKALHLSSAFPDVSISIPKTLVIASSCFNTFVSEHHLTAMSREELPDDVVAANFLKGGLDQDTQVALRTYLKEHTCPLAVRSSGMLEDSNNHAYAGLYRTYMLSNDQPELERRLDILVQAVKLVYASTYYQGPKAYAKRVGHHLEAGQMAVIIQHAVGSAHGEYYYPAISGVAQSRNYYPSAGMKPEEGVATIALGLGKQVVSGERALRFCPKYPKRLLQRSTVEETLSYAQRRFYALKLNAQNSLDIHGRDHVTRRQISDALDEEPVKMLAGTYVLAEHRIKDTVQIDGSRVLTFASVLKFDLFPLAKILLEFLSLGEAAMAVPVEMEFAVDLSPTKERKSRFHLLQMRPMSASEANIKVSVDLEDRDQALCYSQHTVGNLAGRQITDIVYVKPEAFDPGKTRIIAKEVARINAHIEGQRRQYLLVGPGRWGTADPWLGIPVRWADISNVAAIVETVSDKLNVEPSIGAHFFHNLVSLGIGYLSVTRQAPDDFNWNWLTAQKMARETEYVAHVRLSRPVTLKVDGSTSSGVIKATADA